MLTVGDDELGVGDNKNALSEAAEGRGTHGEAKTESLHLASLGSGRPMREHVSQKWRSAVMSSWTARAVLQYIKL